MLIASGQLQDTMLILPEVTGTGTASSGVGSGSKSGSAKSAGESPFAEEFGKAMGQSPEAKNNPEASQNSQKPSQNADKVETSQNEQTAETKAGKKEKSGQKRPVGKTVSARRPLIRSKTTRVELRSETTEAAKTPGKANQDLQKLIARLKDSGEDSQDTDNRTVIHENAFQSEETAAHNNTALASAPVTDKPEDKGEVATGGANTVNLKGESMQDISAAQSENHADPREDSSPKDKQQSDGKPAVIEVRDYRTRRSSSESETAAAESGHKSPSEIADKPVPEALRQSGDTQQQVEIRYVRTSAPPPSGSENLAQRTTESGFAQYVRENVNPSMVKQTGIILRNGNEGEIRLVLRPEQLGNVRMRIRLEENRLSGRIIVDSGFVKETIEQNLEELYRSFRENGFETSGFDVLVGGQAERRNPGNQPRNEISAKTLNQLDDAVPILEEIDNQSEMINLVI